MTWSHPCGFPEYEKEWAWRQAGGGEASEDGDAPASATRLPDVGAEAQQARLKVWDEVLEQLKTIDPALPIVVVTGTDDPARVQAAKEFKVLGVLHKPFNTEARLAAGFDAEELESLLAEADSG